MDSLDNYYYTAVTSRYILDDSSWIRFCISFIG